MVKILSKSGDSLADTYDVTGSIAGIEQLESREVSLVHEMGATIFSERLSGFIRRSVTGAILQNTSWDILIADLPAGPFRILNVVVLTDQAARVDRAQVSLRDRVAGREVPIFVWDTTFDAVSDIRIVENNGAAGNLGMLIANPLVLPNLAVGGGQPQRVGDIAFRGATTGFGAGTVSLFLLVYIAFSQVGGISSRGLPVPGW